MKSYIERLPLIDEAIVKHKANWPFVDSGYLILHIFENGYIGVSSNNLPHAKYTYVSTYDEFNHRVKELRSLYEWCMQTNEITFEYFLTNEAMKAFAIECAKHYGFQWEDPLILVNSDTVSTHKTANTPITNWNANAVGAWIIGGQMGLHIQIYEKPTDQQIKNTEEMLGWEWKSYETN